MKNVEHLFGSMFKKGKNRFVKILSLAMSLTVGIVLFAKIYYENSYNNFYPDPDRLYKLYAIYEFAPGQGEKEPQISEDNRISGGVIPAMRREIPGIEKATQYLNIWERSFRTEEKSKLSGTFILADSSFFDVLPRPVIRGNAKEVLKQPARALVSGSLAQTIHPDGEVIGTIIFLNQYPDIPITIGGVFEDMPRNSSIYYDAIVSYETIAGTDMDGTDSWSEGARYNGYVRLEKNVYPESLEAVIEEMQLRHGQEQGSFSVKYDFIPIKDINTRDYNVKVYLLILAILAFIVGFSGVMNYILITLSGLVKRAREVGVYKCYGASDIRIYGMVLKETLIYFLFSLLLAFLMILAFRGVIHELMELILTDLFPVKAIFAVVGSVGICVFLFSAFLPAWLFVRIPVTAAFKGLRESRRQWKKVLLFVQFAFTGFLFITLLLIDRQYNFLMKNNPGYNPENLLVCNTAGLTPSDRRILLDQIKKMSIVKEVATAEVIPVYRGWGDNVYWPETPENRVNVETFGSANANYLSLLEGRLIEGESFSQNSLSNDVLISKALAEKLQSLSRDSLSLIGRSLYTGDVGLCKITGIFDDIRLGIITEEPDRPLVFYYEQELQNYFLLRLYEINPEVLDLLTSFVKTSFPDNELYFNTYTTIIKNGYKSTDRLRKSLFWSGMFAFIISLIGLIAYVKDEVIQKTTEIAIRKINGGTVKDILQLFVKNIIYIAIPSLIVGTLIAGFLGGKWLESFSEKIPVPFVLFILILLLLLGMITGLVILFCTHVALSNPVESLKSD